MDGAGDRPTRRRATAREKLVQGAGFRLLLQGRPVPTDALTEATGLAHADLEETLSALALGGQVVLQDGHLVGCRGLSLLATAHQLVLAGRLFFTWCAIDALGIPGALRASAEITARCHECDAPVAVTIDRGRLARAQPAGTRVFLKANRSVGTLAET
jgi:alkylmercury lyase